MTTAVKRACDACHRRKVKCDGINPCRNCSSAQLSCTYNAVPQKKGPKGSRAKVISELRETQRQTSLTAKAQNRMVVGTGAPLSIAPSHNQLSADLVKASIEFYFTHMYSTLPILSRQRLEHQVQLMETPSWYMDPDLETYCLLASLCAFVLLQPGMTLPGVHASHPYDMVDAIGGNILPAHTLMEEALKVRRGCPYTETPSLDSLCTTYFIFAYHHQMEFPGKAWLYLREATTQVHLDDMHKEDRYMKWDVIESSRRRRLYWLLLATERAYAFKRDRPLTLQPTINPPTAADDPQDAQIHQLGSFFVMANMFRPFDDSLTRVWGKAKASCFPFLKALEHRFKHDVLPSYLNSDPQLRDLHRAQEWLKNLAWQMNMANGVLPSNGTDIQYPHEVLSMVTSLSGQGMDMLNLGLIEKILSVTCDLTDYLSLQAPSRNPLTSSPRDYLAPIIEMLAVVRSGEYHFLPLLLSKVHDVLPIVSDPRLLDGPEPSIPSGDLFDGFGTAGMAQPPCLAMEEYDNKFSVPRIEEYKPDSSSPSGGAPSTHDVSSPFVNSPSILSPGMEFPHGLQTDYTSMGDMVISPMGNAPNSALNTPGGLNSQQAHFQHPSFTLQSMGSAMGHKPSMTLNGQGMDQTQILNSVFGQGLGNGMNNMGQGMNANMLIRQQPQRSNSFAMPPPQIRTVGDFHAVQRANSDLTSLGGIPMNNLGSELDFNTLR